MSEKAQYGWDGGNGVYPLDKNGNPIAGKDGQPVPQHLKPKSPNRERRAESQWDWQSGCYPVRRRPRAAG